MIHLLIGSLNHDGFSHFIKGLKKEEVRITWADSCQEVLLTVNKQRVDLIILDEMFSDCSGLDCIKKIVAADPMKNCAAVSRFSKKEFHHASEGLGVLMQLSVNPKEEEAMELMAHLRSILSLTTGRRS